MDRMGTVAGIEFEVSGETLTMNGRPIALGRDVTQDDVETMQKVVLTAWQHGFWEAQRQIRDAIGLDDAAVVAT